MACPQVATHFDNRIFKVVPVTVLVDGTGTGGIELHWMISPGGKRRRYDGCQTEMSSSLGGVRYK